MTTQYTDLGIFSDWTTAANTRRPRDRWANPGAPTQQAVRAALAFSIGDEQPDAVQVQRRWQRDGLAGEEISWSVGYGPRTVAWLLKPADAAGPLPGVVALHDHGGFKVYGKEKIAHGPDTPPDVLARHYWPLYYGGRAWANALAREGFAVLVPDCFLWGSRRFPLETIPDNLRRTAELTRPLWHHDAIPDAIGLYNAAAAHHEHLVEKYCRILGTTLAGVIAYEDRVAVNYLAARPDVQPARIGCIGLSGGGLRSGLLQASCDRIAAAVVVGLMTTYEHVLDHNVKSHTWMLYPGGWPRHGDWADLVACRAPSPLLVQYDTEDDLFTPEGMRAAHERLAQHYADAGQPAHYEGQFYPGPHKFDLAMQAAAFAWLKRHLPMP